MGIRSNQKAQSFINTISRLFFEVNVVDVGRKDENGKSIKDRRLRLVLEREGFQYPDWFSCGSTTDEKPFKPSKDGTTWEPKDYGFPGKSMAMWFLNGLMDACDQANVPFNEDDLTSFVGLRIRNEQKTYKTKVRGESIEREKPFVTEILTVDKDGVPIQASGGASPGTTAGTVPEELVNTLVALLEANDGELKSASITAKALKGVVDSDYQTRKQLAATLSSVDFLGAQEVAEYSDGVVTLN